MTNDAPPSSVPESAALVPTPATSARSGGGIRYATATAFVVGGASTLTQVVAVASLGLPVAWDWSTGGLIAVAASIWMWVKCRSWHTWSRWVWLPVGIAVVAGFVAVNLLVASAREAADAEHAVMCSDARGELASTVESHRALVALTWKYQGRAWQRMDDEWVPRPDDGSGSDWSFIDDLPGRPSTTEVWNFYVARGGPQMEADIASLESAISAEC